MGKNRVRPGCRASWLAIPGLLLAPSILLAQDPVPEGTYEVAQAPAPRPATPGPAQVTPRPGAAAAPTPAPGLPSPAGPTTPLPGPPGGALSTGPTAPAPANPFALGNNAGVNSSLGSAPSDLSGLGRPSVPQMLGDQSPFLVSRASASARATASQTPQIPDPFPPTKPPPTPNPRLASSLAPSVRGFKAAENQSPRPQDRVFYSFNYFTYVNEAVNRFQEAPVRNIRIYRHIFGAEKTFDDGRMSVGFRLPINTLTSDSSIQGNFAKPGGTSTALGDLSLFAKFLFRENKETGSLISAGMVVSAPTGPNQFAGATYLQNIHTTTVQPFVGYIYNMNRFWIHGFTSMEFPMNPADVTMLYNDIGIGTYFYQAPTPDVFLTAIAPTVEFHINTPMNHRGVFGNDPAGSVNVVNVTAGLNMEFYKTSVLTIGIVNPITSPRPFDLEAVVLFNVRFGRSRQLPNQLPTMIGG